MKKIMIMISTLMLSVFGFMLITQTVSAAENHNVEVNHIVLSAEIDNELPETEEDSGAQDWSVDTIIENLNSWFGWVIGVLTAIGIPSLAWFALQSIKFKRDMKLRAKDNSDATLQLIKLVQKLIDHMSVMEADEVETRKSIAMIIALSSFDTLKKEAMYATINNPNFSVEDVVEKLKEDSVASDSASKTIFDMIDEV